MCWCCRIATLIMYGCVWLSSTVLAHYLTLSLSPARCMCLVLGSRFVSSCRVYVRSVCLCTWICVHKQFWIRWWIIITHIYTFFFGIHCSVCFLILLGICYFFHLGLNAIFVHAKRERERARQREFMSFVIFHTILFSRLAHRPSREPFESSAVSDRAHMCKLIGCALSDRDIDHNSKVLNAFYLFIGHIHFVCVSST